MLTDDVAGASAARMLTSDLIGVKEIEVQVEESLFHDSLATLLLGMSQQQARRLSNAHKKYVSLNFFSPEFSLYFWPFWEVT